MVGALPRSLTVGGVVYPINTDYRAALTIMQAFADSKLSDTNKVLVMLEILYDDMPLDLTEAAQQAVWFLDCGKTDKSDMPQPKLMDWEQDEQYVFAAINDAAKREVRADDYCHWWTFVGYYTSISGESAFASITNIRRKLSKGEKLQDYERKFYNENKDVIDLKQSADYDEILTALRGE